MKPWFALIILTLSLTYITILRPMHKRQTDLLAFDQAVLGFIDALYLAGIPMHCTLLEIRHYISDLLRKAHKLPSNQHLLEHTTPSGYTYRSYTGHHDHAQFALVCLARYASETENQALLEWCNRNMSASSKLLIHT